MTKNTITIRFSRDDVVDALGETLRLRNALMSYTAFSNAKGIYDSSTRFASTKIFALLEALELQFTRIERCQNSQVPRQQSLQPLVIPPTT